MEPQKEITLDQAIKNVNDVCANYHGLSILGAQNLVLSLQKIRDLHAEYLSLKEELEKKKNG